MLGRGRESKEALSGSERKRTRLWLGRSTPLPHTRVFSAKSSELLENKRVEFLTGARKRKRVWNSLKRKDLNIVGSDEWRVANSGVARMTPHPTPQVSASADSKRLTGEFLVSADSKGVISPLFPAVLVSADSTGVISPLFPADPRGARKCGL